MSDLNDQQTLILERLAARTTVDEAYLFDCVNHVYPEYTVPEFTADLEALLTALDPQLTRAEQGGRWLAYTGGN